MIESSGIGVQRLGRYHLSALVGGVPLGDVYRARVYGVAGFEKQFAVKKFHDKFVDDPEVAKQLAEGARAYSGLDHSRVARLHEFGVADGETFAAVEWVDGVDMGRILAHVSNGGLPLPVAVRIASQVARAVGYAHSKGVIHGGICPTNLLCNSEGEIKVADFGLLKPRLPERPHNDPSLDQRTPYLSPEQFVHEELTPGADVFQLGLFSYELMTGKKPFEAESAFEIAQSIMSSPPPVPELPTPIVDELHKALSRVPAERHPDAGAFADALDAACRAANVCGTQTEAAVYLQHAVGELSKQNLGEASGVVRIPTGVPVAAAGAQTVPDVDAVSADDVAFLSEDITIDDLPETTPVPVVIERRKTQSGMGLATQPPVQSSEQEEIPTAVDFLAPPDSLLPAPRETPLSGIGVGASDALAEAAIADLSQASEPRETGNITNVKVQPAPPKRKQNRHMFWLIASAACLLSAGLSYGLIRYMVSEPVVASKQSKPAPVGKESNAAVEDLVDTPPAIPEKVVVPDEEQPPTTTTEEQLAVADPVVPVENVVDTTPSVEETTNVKKAVADAADVEAWDEKEKGAVAGLPEVPEAPELVPPVPAEPPVATGEFRVTSEPAGAQVYRDGTLVGKTPLTLDSTADSHKLAVIKPGYKLHITEVSGQSEVSAKLEEVTPAAGPAGIKVKCKAKGRYYVFLNGEDVGQLCPTERLGVKLGRHTVEIYDPITDSRERYEVNVKQTRLSLRLRVD